MRILILLVTISLAVLLSNGGAHSNVSSANDHVTSISIERVRAARSSSTKFSSEYTTLTKCGSGLTKKEEKEAEKHGSDIPTKCKGYGGYDIFIGYSACTSHFVLEKGEESIQLAMQDVAWKQKTIEWRMANGKPFAVIMRVWEYAGNEYCATGGNTTRESLIVKGLKGYENIDETLDVKTTPYPNIRARELADLAYSRR